MNIDYVCPMPIDWDNICKTLAKEYMRKNLDITDDSDDHDYWKKIGLPIPLILGGWSFSSDFEKHSHWQDTVKWAEKNELLWVIEQTDFRKHGKIIPDDSDVVYDESQRLTYRDLHKIALEHAINYIGKENIIDAPGLIGEYPDIISRTEDYGRGRKCVIQVIPTTLSTAGCELSEGVKNRLVVYCKRIHAQPRYITMGIGTNVVNRMNGDDLYKNDNLIFKHYGVYIVNPER